MDAPSQTGWTSNITVSTNNKGFLIPSDMKTPLLDQEIEQIINYMTENSNTLQGRVVIKKSDSKLPYTLAVEKTMDETFVLFKKKGKTLGDGGSSLVTEGLALKSGKKVAVKIAPKNKIGRNEREINKMLTNSGMSNFFVVTNIFFDYDRSIKPLDKKGIVEQKTIAIYERLDLELFDLLIMGPLSLVDTVKIAKQIATELEILHNLGIVHMDLKPENILMKNLFPKIADFGFGTPKDKQASARGTYGFWSPEVCENWLKSTSKVNYKGFFGEPAEEIIDKMFENQGALNYLQNLPPFIARSSTDIWSFGMILLLMIDPGRFYEFQDLNLRMYMFFPKHLADGVRETVQYEKSIQYASKEHTDLENEQFKLIFELIDDCLKFNPEERITANQAVLRLDAIYNNLNPTYYF